MNLFWPKPKDLTKKKPDAVRIFKDGREVCNLSIKAGRDEYLSRIRQMWERQDRRCSLEKLVPSCPGYLKITEATFDHDEGRGFNGGHRDDRIERPDRGRKMIPQNGAAHCQCNAEKGSVRMSKLLDFLVP